MNAAASALDASLEPEDLDGQIQRWHDDVRDRALARAAALPPRRPRAVIVVAILLAILFHLLLVLWLRELMQPAPVDDADRIDVRLIDAPPAEPALPIPPPQPLVAPAVEPPQRPMVVAPRTGSTPVARTQPAAVAAPEPLHLYNPDGSLIMPKDMVERLDALKPKPNFVSLSTAPSPIMLPHRPLKIRPNHFAAAWVHPENETLLTEVAGKITDFVDNNLTAKKEFTTPWGTKVDCAATFLFVMAGAGCAWGLPPPPGGRPQEPWKPASVLDER